MSFADTYLRGSDVLGGARVAIAELDETSVDLVVTEAERVVAEEEAAERFVFAPFEDSAPHTPALTLSRVLKSEILGVSDDDWRRFVFAMKTAQPGAISASNALGMFELKPRRLADLGLVRNLKRVRSPLGRLVWVGDFVPPLTQKDFLSDQTAQYQAFVNSVKSYIDGLCDGSVHRPDGGFPRGMSLSGALAILHRGGPHGLRSWNDEEKRFEDTIALFSRCNGIF